MNIVLWVMQALLAAFFLAAGAFHLLMPLARLKASAPWTEDVGGPLTRVIGLLEVLAALGLVLPGVTHIALRCSRTRTTSGRTDTAISVGSRWRGCCSPTVQRYSPTRSRRASSRSSPTL